MRLPPLDRVACPPLRATPLALVAALCLPACTEAPRAPLRWPESPVIYGVVPPLFGEAPLRAVTARLDQLRAIGVDVLWLSPLQSTDDPSHISYATTDYRGVRPDFGTEDELRELVREAHRRDLRVLLDLAPNHTSSEHPYFRDARARGPSSPYWGWYLRDADGEPTHRFDWVNLPELDYARPEVRRMMIGAFVHWVETFDVDGFRIDAAWSIRERAPDFWPELRAALDRVKPGLFLLAEASARDPYYLQHGFDAAYDWSPEVGTWAWADAFSDLDTIGPKLRRALEVDDDTNEAALHRVARFLDNNDTGPRFITRHGLPATRVAAVLQLTLPGIPILYTGQEVGEEYEPYADPPPLSWVDRRNLSPLYRRLTRLRARLPALRHGRYEPVDVADHPAAFAFLRDAGAEGLALVVLDFGAAAVLPLALDPKCGGEWWDELSGRTVQLRRGRDGRALLPVPELSALVLTPKERCGATPPGTRATSGRAGPGSR